MTFPEDFNADRGLPKTSFLGWLDRYVYVDRLNIRRVDILPSMPWWQWIWYIIGVIVGARLAFVFSNLFDLWLQHVPVLRWVHVIVTWLISGLLCGLGYRYLLPAWSSRQTLKGEGWLIGALVLASAVIF